MKYEWRKSEKELYLPKNKPEIIDIPKMMYLTVEGEGNPNNETFSEHIQALYAVAYTIKMSLKKEQNVKDYVDYTVYPLEGLWDLTEIGKELQKNGSNIVDLKEYMKYKLLIRQPNFVSREVFEKFKEVAYKKKKQEMIRVVNFEEITEGKVCQMLHIGSYDSEPESFRKMEQYVRELGLERVSKQHKEIYLSNPNLENPSIQKTVLRFQVK